MFATAPFGLVPPPHLEPTIGRHTSILITSTKDTDRVEWSMFCNLPCQNSQCSKRGMCMIKYALSKQLPGHFMQTDGSWLTDMCRWQLDFDILIRLSLQWLVLLQGTGQFSKMISTMLMWYSENCFEAWSAHLLPQTGHDLGMKSCMIGMHGLHHLLTNIQWNVGPCAVWKCIGTWRNMLPTYLQTVGCPAFGCGRAGEITLLVVLETLGTLRYRTFAGISKWTTGGMWQGMRTGGQIWCQSSYSFAPNHEQDHLKGINVYIALLFSPVPFTGCLRAYRFHFTSLHFTSSVICVLINVIVDMSWTRDLLVTSIFVGEVYQPFKRRNAWNNTDGSHPHGTQLWPEDFRPQTAPATSKAQPSKKIGNTEQRRLAIHLFHSEVGNTLDPPGRAMLASQSGPQ